MIVDYDANFEHPTFDVFGWGVMAIANGATAVNLPARILEDRRERVNSIILPAFEILGLPVIRNGWVPTPTEKWKLRHLVEFSKAGKQFTRPKAKYAGAAKYTVTIRRSPKSPYRNSDLKLWRGFAGEIGAHVIEDYYDVPINLNERLALYAGAEMNFGVWSGPMFLITLTEYPCICFNWGVDEPIKIMNCGIAEGETPPWLLLNQTTLWQKATPRNLRNAWKRYEKTKSLLRA